MRLAVVLAVVAGCVAYPCAAAATRLEHEIIAMEKSSWAAWQRHDTAFWNNYLSDDHLEVHASPQLVGKQDVVTHIASKACVVDDFHLDNFTFRRVGPDTALLVYRASQGTKCGNYAVPSPVWATSLFQRRHGHWLNVFYSHTPIPAPPAVAAKAK